MDASRPDPLNYGALLNYPPPGPIPPAHDYPEYPAGPPRRTLWLSAALAVAVVIIVVLSVVVFTQSKGGEAGTPTAAPQPSTFQSTPQPNSTPQAPNTQTPNTQAPNTTAGQSMTCEGFTASVDPNSQPGWHATIDHLGLAYAVPPDWSVAACGVRMGWAKPCPEGQCVIREMGAVSTVANPAPACTKQNIAMAGVTQSKNPDIKAALEEEAAMVANIYTQDNQVPKVDLTPLTEFTIGTHPAVQMVANVTGIPTNACFGSTAVHSIVVTTVPNVEGSVVFLISLRQGVNATPKPDVIDKIRATLRSPA
jgi:hypothetical protein